MKQDEGRNRIEADAEVGEVGKLKWQTSLTLSIWLDRAGRPC